MMRDDTIPEDVRAEQSPGATEHSEGRGAVNEATFAALYKTIARPLWSYIYRVSGDADLADDILQETFYRFLRVPVLKMDEAQTKAYLYKIATNLLNDHWRSQKRERRWLSGGHERETEDATQNHDLAQSFQELKPQERSLLWLAYVEGSSHREIARTLGLKEQSIRVLLFRVRHKLAHILRQKGFGSEETR